jgi:SAM-dependent methyltransferase
VKTQHLDVAEHNRQVFATVTRQYLAKDLEPAEHWLLRRLKDRWSQIDMLDLGVGAGRTSFTFAAICRDYVGLDPLDEMLELCRSRVGETECVRFVRGDARDLSPFAATGFDLILFSGNGIDALNHDERRIVLRQVAAVLRPGGLLFFSVHNLRCYPLVPPPIPFDVHDPLRSLYHMVQRSRFVRRLKRVAGAVDLSTARARGWDSLRDGAHDFRILNFYIDPELQARELQEEGFVIEATLDNSGALVDVGAIRSSPNVWFCCRAGA